MFFSFCFLNCLTISIFLRVSIRPNLSKIKLVITDVDGVLTDGGLYYSDSGLALKKFNVKDGMGVLLLREKGIETAVITSENTPIVKTRVERLKIKYYYPGVWDKHLKMFELCDKLSLNKNEVLFIGDDVNDISIIEEVGFPTCPEDAVDEIKKRCKYICSKKGGEGAFREIADLILSSLKK